MGNMRNFFGKLFNKRRKRKVKKMKPKNHIMLDVVIDYIMDDIPDKHDLKLIETACQGKRQKEKWVD